MEKIHEIIFALQDMYNLKEYKKPTVYNPNFLTNKITKERVNGKHKFYEDEKGKNFEYEQENIDYIANRNCNIKLNKLVEEGMTLILLGS